MGNKAKAQSRKRDRQHSGEQTKIPRDKMQRGSLKGKILSKVNHNDWQYM